MTILLNRGVTKEEVVQTLNKENILNSIVCFLIFQKIFNASLIQHLYPQKISAIFNSIQKITSCQLKPVGVAASGEHQYTCKSVLVQISASHLKPVFADLTLTLLQHHLEGLWHFPYGSSACKYELTWHSTPIFLRKKITPQSSWGIVCNIFKCKLTWHPTLIPSIVVGIFDLLYHRWQGHRPVRPAVWYFNWSVPPGQGRWSEVKGVNVVQWPAPPTEQDQRDRPQVSPLWWGLLSIIPLHTWYLVNWYLPSPGPFQQCAGYFIDKGTK